jgi:hypothetical protein
MNMTRSDIHRRNAALAGIAVAFVLAAAPAFGQRGSLPSQPPMGKYVCNTSRLQLSPIQGPAGPIMTITYGPSVLGTLELDGKGAYTVNGKSGQYRYDSSRNRFAFANGPLEGWPAVFEQDRNTPILRLSKAKDEPVNAKGPGVGEHSCTLK